MKLLRLLAAGPVFLVGVLLALYGLLGLTFSEPGGGSTYVTLAGHEFDAHLVGAVSLVIGLVVIAAASRAELADGGATWAPTATTPGRDDVWYDVAFTDAHVVALVQVDARAAAVRRTTDGGAIWSPIK